MKTHSVNIQTLRKRSAPGEVDMPAVYAIEVSVHAAICIDDCNLERGRAHLIEDLIDRARTIDLSSIGGGK